MSDSLNKSIRLPNIDSYPLSSAQESLWFLHQLDPKLPAYTNIYLLRLLGPLNRAALENSLNEIRQRHSVLRAVFPEKDGEPRQEIQPFSRATLSGLDLYRLHVSEREAKAVEIARKEILKPFDLKNGPIFRANLLNFDEQNHILMLVSHHIVTDYWSRQVLIDELSLCYNAFSQGKKPDLQEISVQYSDYVLWTLEQEHQPSYLEHLNYWTNAIDRNASPIELPLDHPRAAMQTYSADQYIAILPAYVSSQMKDLCKKERASIYMGFLATLNTLLYRYTGQQTITIGCPFANRSKSEFERIIGFFVNTLPLQTTLTAEMTTRELLAIVRKGMLGAMTHQSLPFEKLVAEIKPERDLSRGPLFQIIFNFRNVPLYKQNPKEFLIQEIDFDNGVTPFDIEFSLLEIDNNVKLVCRYNCDLFKKETIARLMTHWQNIITAAVADPDTPISRLPLLSETDYQKIIFDWNRTSVEIPEACLHQLFEAQAEKNPHAISIVFEDTKLTYFELNQRANSVAHHLRKMGVKANSLVAVCLNRSLEMPVTLLAVQKAGGAYLPLDPAYPQERLQFMLQDSHPLVVLTQKNLLGHLPKTDIPVLCIDADSLLFTNMDTENQPSISSPGNLAFVRYTSGSTGEPKGIKISQRALVNTLTFMQKQPGINSDDVLLAVTTFSFDISDVELFLPLTVGAQVVIVPSEVAVDGNLLKDYIKHYNPTIMQATPATWQMLIFAGWYGSSNLKIITGGEALTPNLANDLLMHCRELWNLYGPTETTIYSTYCKVQNAEPPITIGTPIANTRVYILDSALQPVPIGVTGEIYIGGVGVAQGYLNRPELTDELFIPDPFILEEKVYRTGDLARYLPDGNIEYLGRSDAQVKVRGFRIEPGEIEIALKRHPAVQDIVIVTSPDSMGSSILICFFIPTENEIPANTLHNFLMGKLPSYMIPSRFIALKEFPLLPNGKIDRKHLSSLNVTLPKHAEYFPPQNDVERRLTEIWQQVLNLEHISVTDDFFELGGHSLLGVRLFSKIEKEFGRKLPLTILFQHGTIRALADILAEEKFAPHDAIIALQPNGQKRPLFIFTKFGIPLLHLRELALAFSPDQPVYTIRHEAFDQGKSLNLIEELASFSLNEIQSFLPHGPYYLLGYSSGGFIALEIARLILQQNEKVFLGFLDTYAPGGKSSPPLKNWLSYRIDCFRDYGFRGLVTYLIELPIRLISRLIQYFPATKNFASKFIHRAPRELDYVFASLIYNPIQYHGDVVLFKASAPPRNLRWTKVRNWSEYINGTLETIVVPGNHLTLIQKENAETISRLISNSIERVMRQENDKS